MAFTIVPVVVMNIHTRFDFNLLVGDLVGAGFAVEGHCLSRITDGFDAAVVKFFQSSRHPNFNSRHRWKFWLVDTAKGRSEQTAFNFSAVSVAYIEKWVISQKVVIENLIAILLVDITTMKLTLGVFNACSEDVGAVLVENGFPLC